MPKLELYAALATEVNPPEGEEPIEWLLLTSLPVLKLEDAVHMLDLYRQRWLIEGFHFVLKSGCQVEKLQLETFDRLANAIAVYSVIAWKLTWIIYQSRQAPEISCAAILSREEWQLLYSAVNRGAKPPSEPPSLEECVLLLARLGGFLARKNDGQPGIKVLWRGMFKFYYMYQGYLLALSQKM